MGTRSTIAMEFLDGTVQQIYCHWDGYLSHNGKILQEHYTSPAKVQELVSLGDLSSLEGEIGKKHAFMNPPPGVCTFYGRDRNETGTEARKFRSFDKYVTDHSYEEFEYIFRPDSKGQYTWFVCGHDDSSDYVPLADALKRDR